MKKLLLSSVLALAALNFANAADVNEPKRPECIAPAAPGGGFDLTCKLIQVSLSDTKMLSKPMRVTYMPGGVGVVAYNSMINSRPKDANTVVAFSSGTLLNIATGKHGKYDEKDVKWLASGGVEYGAIAVRADSPIKDLKDFMSKLAADAKSVSIGAGGSIGGQDWMQVALLAKAAKINIGDTKFVAFEGGGDAITSLLGGHIDASVQGIAEFVPHLEANSIRVLAVFAKERINDNRIKEVPTAIEQGYDVYWPVVRGYYMAPNVPQASYDWWVDTMTKLQQTPEFKKQLELRGLYEFNKNGAELDAFVKEQTATYRELAKEFNLIK